MFIRDLLDTWASIYANSAWLRSGISFAHVGALLGGGGLAIAADVGTLKALGRGHDSLMLELRRLRDVHRTVIVSLAVVLSSGALLMAADIDAYLASTAFWIKMALVVALVVNGVVLLRVSAGASRGTRTAGQGLRVVSLLSLILWFTTTLMGAVLPNAL